MLLSEMVQSLYVGHYGRPADPAGQAHWMERFEQEDYLTVLNDFSASPEAQELLFQDPETGEPYDSETLVNNIYLNLFGREADEEGLEFYTNRLESEEFNHGTIVQNIIDGAQNEDVTIMTNKVMVADFFTNRVHEENLAYTDEHAMEARTFMHRDFLTEDDVNQARTDMDSFIDEFSTTDPQPGQPFFAIDPDDNFWYVDSQTLEGLNVQSTALITDTLTDEVIGQSLEGLNVQLVGMGEIYYLENGELQEAEELGLDQDFTFEYGTMATIFVPITNIGDEEGTRTITLTFADDDFDLDNDNAITWSMEQELTLDAGQSTLLAFNIDTTDENFEAGNTYSMLMNTEDEAREIDLSVMEAANGNDKDVNADTDLGGMKLMGVYDSDDIFVDMDAA